MKIKWKKDLELYTYDCEGQEHFIESVAIIKKNEIDEIDICENHNDFSYDIQFGCGLVSFNVKKAWFDKI
jgi:hypothetical protein